MRHLLTRAVIVCYRKVLPKVLASDNVHLSEVRDRGVIVTKETNIVQFKRHRAAGTVDTTKADFYAEHADAQNTRRAYAGHWSRFTEWCADQGVESLRAEDETIAAYISEMADAGKAVSTIDQAVASIRHFHREEFGIDIDPVGAKALKTRKGIRRAVGVAPKRKARPLMADELVRIMKTIDESASGARNRALLSLGWCAALRRSELVGLTFDDVKAGPQGLLVTVRQSKTDQDGKGADIPVQRSNGLGGKACDALAAWVETLNACGISSGPLFRSIDRHGNIGSNPLSGRAVAGIITKAAADAGIDPEGFSGHSLRAGLATSAAKKGVGERKIMETTRHTNLRTVHGYIRQASIWETGALSMLF